MGALTFRAAGRSLDLETGDVVVLESALEHEVEARAECAFLLALAPPP